MEHDIPFGNSNRENGTTFLDFLLFLGIFQWDEPTKRVPFTAEPEIPEILTKWKAPLVSKTSVPFQEIGVKSMRICVRDLSGMGQKPDPLTVNYVVTGGECCTNSSVKERYIQKNDQKKLICCYFQCQEILFEFLVSQTVGGYVR